MALSPLEVLKADMQTVFDIYVNCIIHDKKEQEKENENVWVTSSNASWH